MIDLDKLLRSFSRSANLPMIAVIVEYNTDEYGRDVPDDVPSRDRPRSIYGPFVNFDEAQHWMDYIYPSDDVDVYEIYAIRTRFPKWSYINDPIKYARAWAS